MSRTPWYMLKIIPKITALKNLMNESMRKTKTKIRIL